MPLGADRYDRHFNFYCMFVSRKQGIHVKKGHVALSFMPNRSLTNAFLPLRVRSQSFGLSQVSVWRPGSSPSAAVQYVGAESAPCVRLGHSWQLCNQCYGQERPRRLSTTLHRANSASGRTRAILQNNDQGMTKKYMNLINVHTNNKQTQSCFAYLYVNVHINGWCYMTST